MQSEILPVRMNIIGMNARIFFVDSDDIFYLTFAQGIHLNKNFCNPMLTY